MEVIRILAVILLVLISVLHVYWVFGGKFGLEAAIPETWKKDFYTLENKFKDQMATMAVAIGLSGFALLLWYTNTDSPLWMIVTTRVIGSIFILRMIGDFNILGLFKKKSDTPFAKYDTRYFIPICAFLGSSFWLLSYFS